MNANSSFFADIVTIIIMPMTIVRALNANERAKKVQAHFFFSALLMVDRKERGLFLSVSYNITIGVTIVVYLYLNKSI